ncbi:MAG: cobalt-precorrin-5B (C(1))-methyltransferase CbiD [Pseudoflavonifractor sp.]
MARLEEYITVGRDRLRCGYTTGTCAAAAARGGAELLLSGSLPAAVVIDTPAGISVAVELLCPETGPAWAGCAAEKDGGDDPDVTHGALIFVRVSKIPGRALEVDGGPGVGRVTRPGLDQPVGAAAINHVPRAMIAQQLDLARVAAGYEGGLRAEVSVPQGEALARQTFNPRLGIVGGISILGTGGIVRPMSEAALLASMELEFRLVAATGSQDVLVTPGNYGEDFARDVLGLSLDRWALCSNYIGAAIDCAAGLGFRRMLLVGHLGKLVKVAAGIMNTHSRVADGRAETLCTHGALCGGGPALIQSLYAAATTDAAVALLDGAGLRAPVMASIAAALDEKLRHRAGPNLEIQALFFSNQYGILGQTPGAERLLGLHRAKKGEEL